MDGNKKSIVGVFLTIFIIILLILSISILVISKTKFIFGKNQLSDMVYNICSGDYKKIYSNDNFKNEGIFESTTNNYVYYVKDPHTKAGYYIKGEIYEIGYVYHEMIENIFPDSNYFYRESRIAGIRNELKIAFEAKDENDLIKKYGIGLYNVFKNMNENYKKDLELIVYFNSTLEGINNTYDKLFLMAIYNNNNVTQSFRMGRGYGKYAIYDGNPWECLSPMFADKNKYPENARNALKYNRHIRTIFDEGNTITEEEFINKLKKSFKEPL